MKIVLPIHHYLPRHNSGAELLTHRLAQRLQALGHDVEVVCIDAIDRGRPDALDVVADVHDGIPVWRLSFDLIHAPQRQVWNYDNALIHDWFQAYLGRTRPDVLHAQGGYLMGVAPLWAAVEQGVATVVTLHDYWYVCPNFTLMRGDGSLCTAVPDDPAECAWCTMLYEPKLRRVEAATRGMAGRVARSLALAQPSQAVADRRARLAETLKSVDAVIALSRFQAVLFEDMVQPGRLHISSAGLDVARFSNSSTGSASAESGVVRIGYTGQIARHKGVHILIQAFRTLVTSDRSVELHVYGGLETNPDYVNHLRELAAGDARIIFHGRFDNQRVPHILHDLDVLVVPSTWYEIGPLTLMESLAAGTPVVASALGGMSERIIEGVNGLLFKSGDSDDLARQLQRLIHEPELLARLRAGARANPPRDIESEVEQLLAIYEGVTAKAAQTIHAA